MRSALDASGCHRVDIVPGCEGHRNVSGFRKVSFLVEKTDKGVRVMVKGKPEDR